MDADISEIYPKGKKGKSSKLETKPKPEPRRSAIERAYPDVRQRVGKISQKVENKKLPWPLSNPQVTLFFPRLKATVVNRARENGYIKPEKGGDHLPVFSESEIILLLCLDEFGNNLTPRQSKDLKKIIQEEVAKRSSKKK